MRVLYLINSLEAGGAQRYVIDVLNRIRGPQVDARLVSLGTENYYQTDTTFPVLHLGTTKRTRNVLRLAPLVQLINAFRPQILHTHLRYADSIGQVVGRLMGVPRIISTIHNTVEWPRERGTVITSLEDIAARYADVMIAVSPSVRDHIVAKRGVSEYRTRVIPCGVDLAPFASPAPDRGAVRAALGVGADDILFVCTAHFRPEKRHDLLLHRFRLLRDQSPRSVRLILLGKGGVLENDVRRTIGETFPPGVVTMKSGSKEDIAAILSASDIYVMHSELEGASLAVVEAMASGLPVLLPRLPHFTSQVEEHRDGLFFGFDEPHEFLDRAMRLIRNPSTRLAMGSQARRHAFASYGMSTHVEKILALYASQLSLRSAHSLSAPGMDGGQA